MRLIFHVNSMHRSLLMWPLLLAAATAFAHPPKVQCVLVENAQIARQRVVNEGKFGRANHGHQIAPGVRSVLAIRVYEDDGSGADAQVFKKATFEFKEIPHAIAEGEEVTVNVLRSYYAEGSSGWVADGGYSWATNPFHQILIRRNIDGLHINLKSIIEATNESPFAKKRRKERINVDVQCPIRRQAVMELTPWVGRVGTNWLSFYMQE
jgi:hypothetical protein